MPACGGVAASITSAATRAATSNRWSGSSNSGRTPAEEMLDKFNGAWGGSVEPAYRGIRVLIERLQAFCAVHPPYRLMALKWRARGDARVNAVPLTLESNRVWGHGRLLRACLVTLAFAAAVTSMRPALAQANFDRPGGDYLSAPVPSGDPADCALVCERDRRCRAWSFNYPTGNPNGAVCWLKSNVPARAQSDCCVSGVRGAGVVEPRNGNTETSIDRFGGDYRSFRSQEQRRRRRLQGRLRRRQQMPRLDLCAARLCRQGGALLPEERHQAAAAQAGVYLGRGAVGARRHVARGCMRSAIRR